MNAPQIVESPAAPLNPELLLPRRSVTSAPFDDATVSFLESGNSSRSVAVIARRKGRLRLALDKHLLLKEGVLIVSSPERSELFRIPWKPGQALLSKPATLTDEDIAYFQRVEFFHPQLAGREACEVTFVIPAKNGALYLKRTLQALETQEELGSHEVIVIDSGSTDNTRETALAGNALLVQISAEEFGHGRTRNLGAHLARGKYVCFVNGDAVPMDDRWFISMEGHFKNPAIKGVCSRQVPRDDCDPIRRSELLNFPIPAESNDAKIMCIDSLENYLSMSPMEKRRLLCFETVSCLVKRSDIVENPFPHTVFGEDLEWAKYMLENGSCLVLEPLSRIEHSHDFYRSARGLMQRAFDDHYLLAKTIGPVMDLSLGGFIRQLAFLVCHDWRIIAKEHLQPWSKLGWFVWVPFVEASRVFGMAMACSSFAETALGKHLFSSVARIKAQ